MPTGHNILESIENPVGTWTLTTNLGYAEGGAYGVVKLVRRGPEIGYRAELIEFGVVGYYLTLLTAAQAVSDAAKIIAQWHRDIAPFTQSRQPLPPHLERPPIRVVGV